MGLGVDPVVVDGGAIIDGWILVSKACGGRWVWHPFLSHGWARSAGFLQRFAKFLPVTLEGRSPPRAAVMGFIFLVFINLNYGNQRST